MRCIHSSYSFVGLIGFVFILGASVACFAADEAAANGHWLLAKYDQNGDQAISLDEVSQKREKVFARMDQNQDGDVSLDEYALMDTIKRGQIVEARFVRLDSNRDGRVSVDEYRAYSGSFDRFDQDRNGFITSTEIQVGDKTTVAKVDNTRCVLWFCLKTQLD